MEKKIELEYYVPIIPAILVNGAKGIGTGWSTSIPNFNPTDIIQNLKRKINHENMDLMHLWYRGFSGEIKQAGTNKYSSHVRLELYAYISTMINIIFSYTHIY